MIELHLPWLEAAILMPLLGALWVSALRNPDRARRHALVASGLALVFAVGAWRDFILLHTFEAHDRWDVIERLFHKDVLVIDELSAPLLPLGALLFFLTELATLRTKVRRFSFSRALVSEGILLATLACRHPWAVVGLLAGATVPPSIEMKERRKPTRVYAIHMGLFVALLVAGQALVDLEGKGVLHSTFAVVLIAVAALLRNGVVPLHCWMTDLFEQASFGTALLHVTPMIGAYGAMRLVLPIAPDWVLQTVSIASLFTAVYSGGMALVQTEGRRFFCYVFLSNSSLVLVGMETATPIGLTGALCIWLSVGLAMGGFGLTLRAVEARCGRLSLNEFHGLYERMPMQAAFFLLTGLAAIGFPGTIGFVAVELLIEGAVEVSATAGVAVVATAALGSLAVLLAYLRIFTGARPRATIDLRMRPSERLAVLVLTLLILGGGLLPQPGVASRYHAATKLISDRTRSGLHVEPPDKDAGASSASVRAINCEDPTAPISISPLQSRSPIERIGGARPGIDASRSTAAHVRTWTCR